DARAWAEELEMPLKDFDRNATGPAITPRPAGVSDGLIRCPASAEADRGRHDPKPSGFGEQLSHFKILVRSPPGLFRPRVGAGPDVHDRGERTSVVPC